MVNFLRWYLIFVSLISFVCGVLLIYENIKNYKLIYVISSILALIAAIGIIYIAIWIIP